MRKIYEIFKLLRIQKTIVAVATIWGNTVIVNFFLLKLGGNVQCTSYRQMLYRAFSTHFMNGFKAKFVTPF